MLFEGNKRGTTKFTLKIVSKNHTIVFVFGFFYLVTYCWHLTIVVQSTASDDSDFGKSTDSKRAVSNMMDRNTTESIQEQLRTNIHHLCQKHRSLASEYKFGMQVGLILTDENHKVLYGEIPKCASSVLKKLMVVLSNRMVNFSTENLTNLHELKHSSLQNTKDAFLNILHEQTYIKQFGLVYLPQVHFEEGKRRINSYFSFVFVRNPYHRLVSAYKSKLNPGAAYYHELYGTKILKDFRPNATEESLKLGNDVTFTEFISYVVNLHNNGKGMDEHWKPQYKLCHPCLIPYAFIGKFESIREDIKYVMKQGFAFDYQKIEPLLNFRDSLSDQVVYNYFKNIPAKQMSALRDLYRLDFELFNYSKDVPGAEWWQVL